MAFGLTDIQGQVFGSALVRVYGANGKQKFPSGGGGVTSVTATSPITSSGGATPVISTLMNTNKLIGRSTAGAGVMEEITIGSGLSLSGGTLSATGSGGLLHGTAAGTDTYTVTIAGVASYADGDAYLIRFTNGNTTGCTLNINGLGAITLYRNNDGVLIGGDIVDGAEMLCIYNSTLTGFQVIGTAPNTLLAYVTNDDSVTLTKGMVVYAFGGTGDRMTVKRAANTADATSAQTVGLVLSTSIAANQKGLIMMQGLLDGLSILPTATYSDGDPIYLGATAGAITNVKPYAPNHLVYLGVVTTANNGSAGRMYVKVQNGYELDELHNVQAQTPTYKDTLWYDNTVSPAQWKTASISTILGYTPVPSTRTLTINGVAQDLSADRSWTVGNVDLSVLATSTTTERLDNWAPVGWPGATEVVKVIHHTPNITNKINIISGLSNGTAGRIVSIRNMSTDNLILLENQGTGSLAANRFRFDGRGAYFLFPEETVTLLYDGVEWGQFGSKTNNGHDYFDDFLGINYAAGATTGFSITGFATANGTGALARNENPMSQAIGTIGLTVGTTTTGSAAIKSNPRGQWNMVTGGGGSKCLVVSKLQLPTAPTVAENWFAMMGVSQNANATGVNYTSGVGWVADINSTFWQCRAANTSNTIISTTISALPLSTNPVVVGCWYPNTNGDCVYFYSADGGVVYTVDSMFVRVSSGYGGAPSMGIQKSAGVTSRTMDVDYLAISKKGGTI